ncbi:MAG: tetratricopeptide repeat-containing protein [Pirellulaceae bacterium]
MSNVLRSANHRFRTSYDRDAVDETAKNIDQAFLDRPKVRSAVLSTLASTYSDLGEFIPAEQYAREALEIYRQHCGATHEATLSATDNLTRILYHQNKFAECETMMRQLVTDTETAFGPDSKEALIAVNNLATQLFQRNQLDESGQLLERVLASKRRTLGDADESTLATWGNYASLLLQQGQKDEALTSLQTIADLWMQHYGERNPGSLMALEHLAFAQSYVDVADAIPIYVRLVELRSDVLSNEHPHTMRTILNLGTAYLGTNQPNDAIPLFRQLKNWNESNASQAGVRYDADPLLAIALASAGQATEAEELMRHRVSRLAESVPGTDSRLQVARVYWAYCLVQAEMVSAANTELESLTVGEDAAQLPPDVSGLRSVLIGRAELENGAFEQAEPKLLNGYATLKDAKGRKFVLTQFAQNSIRLLYQNWERPERWKQWESEQ